MSTNILTLVDDIYGVLSGKIQPARDSVDWDKVGAGLATLLSSRFQPPADDGEAADRPRQRGTLRASNIGVPCERQLWYKVNKPDLAEDLVPYTYNKFLYGDLVEAQCLQLAKLAGHRVEGEQTEIDVHGIKGHRDAVVDGVTVDVKSASSYSFERFKSGLRREDDKFGYLDQLCFYVAGAVDDPCVTEKNKGAFLAVDKVSGEICLDVHEFSEERLEELRETVLRKKALVDSEDTPARSFSSVPDGKSGNYRLGVECSYCPFKFECWDQLSEFFYARGPVYLTQIVREPDVTRGRVKGMF